MCVRFWRSATCAVILLSLSYIAHAEDLYCGAVTCYEALGLSRDASKRDIRRAYRKIALKEHPDKTGGSSSEAFVAIATAYEILSDDEAREDYDFYLDHPEQQYEKVGSDHETLTIICSAYNQYRYYRRHVFPQSDLRLVIGIPLTLLTIFMYWYQLRRYKAAVAYLMLEPKTERKMEVDVLRYLEKKSGIESRMEIEGEGGKSKGKSKRNKQQLDVANLPEADIDEAWRHVEAETIANLKLGTFTKPGVLDLLPVQLVLLPVRLVSWLVWQAKWFVNHTLRHLPYDESEQEYITYRILQEHPEVRMNSYRWAAMDPEDKAAVMEHKVWEPAGLEAYVRSVRAELQDKYGSKYKRYLRYKKKMR